MRGRLFAFLVLAVSLGLAQAEGGPSTFGYDAASTCGKPYARVARSRVEDLPCDFRRENWCTIAGNAYPWQAVRRFVQENQGLMRRMYGDEKHISILETELKKNDVELDFEDDQNHLYADDKSSSFRQNQYDDDYELDRRSRDYHSRSLNAGSSGKIDKPKTPDGLESRYHSHPNETPTASTSAPSSSTTLPPTTTTTTTTTTKNPTTRVRLTTSSTSTTKSTTTSTTTPKLLATTKSEPSSTTPVVTLDQIAKVQNFSINEIIGQIDRFDANVDELTEIPEDFVDSTDLPISSSVFDGDFIEEVSESQQNQQFRPRPEYRPPETKPESTSAASSMEGQLYQDVAAKDKEQPPVLKVRGINACPVKEEVVAPFWANNTRGEVLALLNLYPFEQYVHWEKCTDEHKQMYCRDGCKCEQQYKLHRLLAYDPNNECRGIFSDWFKFPSCCICRCYDLPLEFRVTSRSPRTSFPPKRKLKVRPPKSPPPSRQRFN